jgi:hypothetical protein
MLEQIGDVRQFAVILSFYALAEFLVKRLLWKPALQSPWRMLLGQAVVVVAIMAAGSLGFISWKLFCGFVVIAVFRGLCERFLFVQGRYRSLERFLILQVSTIVFLGVAWQLARPLAVYDWYTRFETETLANMGSLGACVLRRPTLTLVVLSAYAFMVDGGARLVRGTLDKFPGMMERVAAVSGGNGENRGEWIGVLERIITLTFVLTGNYTAVAFALTAKSIARYKELDDKNFAEYYLLGTSASVATALIAGTFLRLFF